MNKALVLLAAAGTLAAVAVRVFGQRQTHGQNHDQNGEYTVIVGGREIRATTLQMLGIDRDDAENFLAEHGGKWPIYKPT